MSEAENGVLKPDELTKFLTLVPTVLQAPRRFVWSTYAGKRTCFASISKKPARAADGDLTDEHVIVRHEDDEVMGRTTLHASQC